MGKRGRAIATAALALAAAALLVAAPPPAGAAIFEVNTTGDLIDLNPGNGVCDTSPQAGLQCSLRAAVGEANALAGADVARVPAGNYVVSSFYNELFVSGPLTIAGPRSGQRPVIAPDGVRAFNLSSGSLTLRDLVVRGGDTAGQGAGALVANGATLILVRVAMRDNHASGGSGGAIFSQGRLRVFDSVIGGSDPANGNSAPSGGGIAVGAAGQQTLIRDSTIAGNEAINAAGVADGGGVYSNPSATPLIIERSRIVGNGATRVGAACCANGGGILSNGPLELRDSLVASNDLDSAGPAANSGGGIRVVGAIVSTHILRSQIRANGGPETASGGGLDHQSNGPLMVRNSTFAGNEAGNGGGALTVLVSGPASLENATLAGNRAGFVGGGVYAAGAGSLTISHSTLASNQAPSGGASLYRFGGSAVLRATILAGPPAANCAAESGGAFVSAGFNVETGSSCGLSGIGDAAGASPRLRSLGDHGGPVATVALRPSSPAVDRVRSNCPAPATDARGVRRPQRGRCDSGAYELARCAGVVVNRVGTGGRDRLVGTPKRDGILGLGGNDVLKGRRGNDGICGGKGKDRLNGGPGRRDRCLGGPGRDRLRGCERGS
ncbi:MAG TPA: choice-of-anchor Q domain-containing protein [Solirubrobacterales bacterium]|nr:choice-of-anchor Q domain-containing protein [Solirubrobacterales bacterium]